MIQKLKIKHQSNFGYVLSTQSVNTTQSKSKRVEETTELNSTRMQNFLTPHY